MVQVAGGEQRGERGPDDELKLQSKAILQFALDLGLKGSRPRPPDTTVEKTSARADLSIATLLTLFLLAPIGLSFVRGRDEGDRLHHRACGRGQDSAAPETAR